MSLPAYSTNDSATVICIEQKRADYMGNPQLDDGHTRIANELLEAILSFPFSGRQMKVVLAIIRKTYGFNKKEDYLAQSVISDMTGIDKSNVSRTLKELSELNVVAIDASRLSHKIALNKRYLEWRSSCQNDNSCRIDNSCQNNNETVAKIATKPLPIQQPQKKERKKDNTSGQNFVLPDWIDRESWEGYVAMRKKIRKPITEHAVSLLVKKLDGFRSAGFSVADILNNSTMNCWQGVFEPKIQQPQRPANNFGGAL